MCNVQMVIGSWGSYSACNERALGSKWLDVDSFDDWAAVLDELRREGFQLRGIDEELFIQCWDGLDFCAEIGEYESPERVFNVLKESGILDDADAYEKAAAFVEAEGWQTFAERVEEWGSCWDDDITFLAGYSLDDYAREIFDACGYAEQMPDFLVDYFDFEKFGRDLLFEGGLHEVNGGILEVR